MSSPAQPTRAVLYTRHRVMVLDDPLRRCYNGAYGAHHYEWSAWEVLDTFPADRTEHNLAFWQDLNAFAVSQRGESARKEFKVEPWDLVVARKTPQP